MKKLLQKTGFTLIEILIIVSIIGIIASITLVGLQNYSNYQRFEQEVALVRATFFDSHTEARSAVGDQAHGVKISGNSLIQYSGNNYVAGAPSNQTTTLTASIVSYSLTGGVSEINFSQLVGIPNATGTVTVTGIRYSGSKTIKIGAAGVVQ